MKRSKISFGLIFFIIIIVMFSAGFIKFYTRADNADVEKPKQEIIDEKVSKPIDNTKVEDIKQEEETAKTRTSSTDEHKPENKEKSSKNIKHDDTNINLNKNKDDIKSNEKVERPKIPNRKTNIIFIGDSITEGISFFDFTYDSNVIAEKGFTVKKALKSLNRLEKINADKIFIQLGLNDLLYGISSEEYKEDYIILIQNVKQRKPGAKIYVQAIFPVSYNIEQKRPMLSNARIDDFNNAIESMAKEQGVTFLNVSLLFKGDNNCMNEQYTSDGIHLKYDSYVKWLDFLEKNAGPLILK